MSEGEPLDHDRSATSPEHVNCGVIQRHGDWHVWCQCGFIESGWPSYALAKASLINHKAKVEEVIGDCDCHVEVDATTHRRLLRIADALGCNVEAALEEVIREFLARRV